MLASSASRSERRTWSVSLAIILFAAIVPPLTRWLPFTPSHALSWTSPTIAFWTIAQSRYNSQPGTFWGAVAGVHLLSWAFLVAASIILPRSWQQRELGRPSGVFVPMQAAKRQALLDRNPMLWLASRDQKIKTYLWGLVALFGAGFLAVWIASGFAGAILGSFAVCVFIIHFLIAARVAFHVCHAFVDARDSGLLQLLLSTPFSSNEILDGFRAAFRRLFAGPVILLLWVEGAIVGSYFLATDQKDNLVLGALMLVAVGALATAFVMDLHAVATYGMWVSLKAKKPSQAFNKTVLMVLVLPLGIGMFCCNFTYPVAAILKNLIFFSYRTPLYRDFRKLIAEREASP
jgi:hypothetical protein